VIRECLALCIVRKVCCSPGQSVESRWAPEATKFPRVLSRVATELLVSKAETVSPKLSKVYHTKFFACVDQCANEATDASFVEPSIIENPPG